VIPTHKEIAQKSGMSAISGARIITSSAATDPTIDAMATFFAPSMPVPAAK
jgi:hypothetical protein